MSRLRHAGLLAALALPACDIEPEPSVRLLNITVGDDAYDDGALNPGDAAEITVEIVNDGGEPDGLLTCTVTGGGQGISVDARDDSLNFGICRDRCDSRFRVTVDPEVPPGTRSYFNCDLGDAGDLSIEVRVQAPDLRPEIGRIVVSDDPTQDGVLNPGESATVTVHLDNPGSARLSRSTCVVGSDTAGVTVLAADDDLTWNRCAPASSCGTSRFRVQVGPEVLPGTMIDWRCDLVDEAETVYPLTFRRRVEASAARPLVAAIDVDDDGGDGALNPDEAATLTVHLDNAGLSKLTRATCTVTTNQAWLEVLPSDDDLTWNDCAADRACGTSRVRVETTRLAPPGEDARMACELEDSLGGTWPLDLRVPIGPASEE